MGCAAAIPAAWLDAYACNGWNLPPNYSNRCLPQTKSRPETLILRISAVNRLDLSYSFGNNAPVWGIF